MPELQCELWIVIHADLRHTARIRAFFDVVGARLAGERTLFAGEAIKRGGRTGDDRRRDATGE